MENNNDIFDVEVEITKALRESYFEAITEEWIKETCLYSDPNQIYQNNNYKLVILLGKDAIPLILKDWETTDNHWFHALNVITKENPVKPENRGCIKRMKQDWIEFLTNNYK